jgi:proline dehydrogenase
VLDYLCEARAQFAGREGVEKTSGDLCQNGLLKDANMVLVWTKIHGKLPANARVHLGKERRGQEDEINAPLECRGAKSRHITQHSASKNNHEGVPVKLVFRKPLPDELASRQVLVLFPGRHFYKVVCGQLAFDQIIAKTAGIFIHHHGNCRILPEFRGTKGGLFSNADAAHGGEAKISQLLSNTVCRTVGSKTDSTTIFEASKVISMDIDPSVKFEDTAIAFRYKSDSELKKANFIFTVVNNPFVSSLATGAVKVSMSLGLPVKGIVRSTVFSHFCGGETIDKTEKTVKHLGEYNVRTILDFSVEGAQTEEGFDATMEEILHTFDKAKTSAFIPFCVFKMTGMANAALLEKIQSGLSLTHEEAASFDKIKGRVDSICSKAHAMGIPILIDAEDTWIQNPIDTIVYDMMAKYNREKAIVFNTYQLYRTDSLTNLRNAHHEATMHNYFLGVKLVRGAYMEKERERAMIKGYPDPIFPTKQATDDAFNKSLAFCIDNKQRISVLCGSHNEYSNQYLTVLMEKHGMKTNDNRVWFAQLLGMSDNISFNLAKAGYNVAKYVPYGPVESVMPYLLRRATENTSVAGQSSRELSLIRKELARRRNSKA